MRGAFEQLVLCVCDRLQTAAASSSAVNDRDMKDGRSEHTAVSSHSSLLKEADAKQRQLERSVLRDRAVEHVQRGAGSHQAADRDEGRRDGGGRKPSESELQHRQERRHSGSHHHHHHHHQQQQQHHGSTKDDPVRHNRHAGRLVDGC